MLDVDRKRGTQMHGHRIIKANRLALLVAAVSVFNVYADDPPGGGDGGGTNSAPTTFVAQPFPLNRIPTS